MQSTLTIFVATRLDQVPAGCRRYISVDGSVPGAEVTWDHHLTGHPVNLDAMPEEFDTTGFDGVGTTMADTDAMASVVAVLAGGRARLSAPVLQVLLAASHWCDHLQAHPDLPAATNQEGRRLRDWFARGLSLAGPENRSEAFAARCREVWRCVEQGTPLPQADPEEPDDETAAARLVSEGRIQRYGQIALVDLRDSASLPVDAIYRVLGESLVAVLLEEHPNGGRRYTVGCNPFVERAPTDLTAALTALAQAEYTHGPPARRPSPGPGSENWGGRETVFGSPWNYGSRLEPREVIDLVRNALELPE